MEHYKSDIEAQEYQIKRYQRFNLKPNQENVGSVSKSREQERIVSQDYFFDGSGKNPRYYQRIAINRSVEAIAQGQQRILLTWRPALAKPTPPSK